MSFLERFGKIKASKAVPEQKPQQVLLSDAEVAEKERRLRLSHEYYNPNWKLEVPKKPESWIERNAPGIAKKVTEEMPRVIDKLLPKHNSGE